MSTSNMARPRGADPRMTAILYDMELQEYYDSLNRNPPRSEYHGILAKDREASTRSPSRVCEDGDGV
jgi:hypothetical protein